MTTCARCCTWSRSRRVRSWAPWSAHWWGASTGTRLSCRGRRMSRRRLRASVDSAWDCSCGFRGDPGPPGAYRLRFIVAEEWRVEEIALELPTSSEFTFTVTPGRISYLGTVLVQSTIQVVPDVERERATWDAFLKKYPKTPWADLARARLDSLPAH